MIVLAHGVGGNLYQSPIPLYAYLAGAAATVLISFLVIGFSRKEPVHRDPPVVLGGRTAGVIRAILKWSALGILVLTILSGVVIHENGLTFAPLAFWVGLIVGMVAINAVLAGSWSAADPWFTLDELYRVGERDPRTGRPPWYFGPVLVYALFWFELVSGVGFDSLAIVVVLFGYTAYALTMRDRYGDNWREADPLSIIFGFAGRAAPFELTTESVVHKGFVRDLVSRDPMPLSLFASIWVLLASTTLDNVRETIGWTSFRTSTGLDAVPDKVFDSLALAAFTLPFLASFLGAVWLAKRWMGDRSLVHLARVLGWTLIPIPVAYVLAHNAPAMLSWVPDWIRSFSDPFQRGWNLLGTANFFDGFQPSARLAWFIEIALVVGGHVLGVIAAHNTALLLAPNPKDALRSQYALTALMSLYTIATLWLLSQPLVR